MVLTDFGIARVEGSSALTMTGEVIGSPEFLAPERALGRTAGPESDLWSLGALLYAAVEGASPFRQDTPLSTLRAIVDEELPPPHRAGALAPVVEGLLRKDPAERLPAERAERDLRLVGRRGHPCLGARRVRRGADGRVRHDRRGAPGRGGRSDSRPLPGPATTAGTAGTSPPAHRDRRARAVLIAGVAVLALAAAGLTYGLLNRSDGGDGTEGADGGGGSSASAPATGPDESADPSPSKSSESESESEDDETESGTPPQSVKVSVAGSHPDYSGTCPPPRDRAPAFTATFTVGRLPAEVGYRWVTDDGSVSDPGWRTLSFPADGDRSDEDTVVVTTREDSGAFEGAVRVEVRVPGAGHVERRGVLRDLRGRRPRDGASASSDAP